MAEDADADADVDTGRCVVESGGGDVFAVAFAAAVVEHTVNGGERLPLIFFRHVNNDF